ncbi:MAG TPA: FAD-dependent oxidoreductase, partial [Chthoniobacterales bacterium]
MRQSFDAIIIGAGQGGPTLAGRFAAAGMKVALAERNLFGGTCVNTGCTPTKTMVASAYVAHLARRASDFGVQIEGEPRVDMRRVKARKDAIVEESRTGLTTWLRSLPNCTVVQGHARFESPHEVRIGNETLSAERIFINVGGRAAVPPMPGLDQVPYFTNGSLLEVDFVPPHLVVIGGSYVGLEFAQKFRRFGSEVTVVEMGPRLVRREDEDVSNAIREFLQAEGIRVRLDAKCISFSKRDGQTVAHLDCATGAREVEGTHVLLAVGRIPNTGD